MKEFTISKIDTLGDRHPEYGQQYWAETNEQLEPVMFNLVNQNIRVGDKITCEIVELKTSKKGKDYHRLKKVKVLTGLPQGIESGPQPGAPLTSEYKLDQILELLKEINAKISSEILPLFDESGAPTDSDNINPDDIPF